MNTRLKEFFSVCSRDDLSFDHSIYSYIREYFPLTQNASLAKKCLVVGGDGTMLRSVTSNPDSIHIGLHVGDEHSVGHLMNEIDGRNLEEIREGKICIIKCYFLEAKLFSGDELVETVYGFNDIYSDRLTRQASTVRIWQDGKILFNSLRCDGIITATPAGSTAYNANANGLILQPGDERWVMTGNNTPYRLKWKTSLLDKRDEITIEVMELEKRPVVFVVDGREINSSTAINRAVLKRSDKFVKLGFAENSSFCRRNGIRRRRNG